MANLQDLINLSKTDGGKFFVIDETGEARLVILPIKEYQRLLLNKLKKQIEDVENINREIIRAQLKDETKNYSSQKPQTRVDLSSVIKAPDMREEVIDPGFDFEAPKGGIDDL